MTIATRTAGAQAESGSATRFAHQPALDGLRALAVLAVLVYHQSSQWASGGFLGVDVFFVLSGYLITSILLTEHESSGRIDFARFWGRRARRLLPALGVFLLLIVGFSAYVASPLALDRLRSDSLATLFYVENYWQASRSFIALPVGHMWSLSIEEQFYFVWPLLLVGLLWLSRNRSRYLLAGIAALATASALLMAFSYDGSNFGYLYVATQMRAHELLIGAGLAVLIRNRRVGHRLAAVALEIAGIAGLVVFAVLVYTATLPSAWLYRGGYAVVALVGAMTIAAAVQPTSPLLGRLLTRRPLIAVGTISYGLYLYHEPIYFFLVPDRVHVDETTLFAMRLAATLLFATASYLLVERPIRAAHVSLKQFAAVGVPAAAVLVALIFASTSGAVPITPSSTEASVYAQLAAETPKGAAKLLVVGDVLAASLRLGGATFTGAGIYGALDYDWCDFQTSSLVIGGKLMANPPCAAPVRGLQAAVSGFRPDVTVLIIGTQEVLDRADNGRALPVGAPQTAAFMAHQLESVREKLTADGAPMLVATVPCMRIPLLATSSSADQAQRIAWVNTQLRLFAREHASTVRIIDFGKFLCDGSTRRVVGGQSLGAADGVGLSTAGARATWQWLAPLVQNVRKQPALATP